MSSPASPSFFLRLLICTSIVRSSTIASSPIAASISSNRVNARPAWRSKTSSRRNSVGVSGSSCVAVKRAMTVAVDHDSLAFEDRSGRRLVSELLPPQLFLDPLDQDLHAVGLGDVIVSTGGKPDQFVGLFGLGRHHDDGDVTRPRAHAQLAAHVEPGLLRQHQVEHNRGRAA